LATPWSSRQREAGVRCSSSRREARGRGRKPRDAASGSKGRKEQGDEVVWAWARQELRWDAARVCLGGEIGLGRRELVWVKSVK
jgi:hypothetical protein